MLKIKKCLKRSTSQGIFGRLKMIVPLLLFFHVSLSNGWSAGPEVDCQVIQEGKLYLATGKQRTVVFQSSNSKALSFEVTDEELIPSVYQERTGNDYAVTFTPIDKAGKTTLLVKKKGLFGQKNTCVQWDIVVVRLKLFVPTNNNQAQQLEVMLDPTDVPPTHRIQIVSGREYLYEDIQRTKKAKAEYTVANIPRYFYLGSDVPSSGSGSIKMVHVESGAEDMIPWPFCWVSTIDFIDSQGDNNFEVRKASGQWLDAEGIEWRRSSLESIPAVYSSSAVPRMKAVLECVPAVTKTVVADLYITGSLDFGDYTAPMNVHFINGRAEVILDAEEGLRDIVEPRSLLLRFHGLCKDEVPMEIFVIHNQPRLANMGLFTKENIRRTVTWAKGGRLINGSQSNENIPYLIQKSIRGIQIYKAGTGVYEDPFSSIPALGGDCIAHADWMMKALHLLGVDADAEAVEMIDAQGARHYFFALAQEPHWLTPEGDCDGNGIINQEEPGYPDVLRNIYINGSSKPQAWVDQNAPWNFHGFTICAGYYWDITFFMNPGIYQQSDIYKYPNGPLIRQPGPLYPNGMR